MEALKIKNKQKEKEKEKEADKDKKMKIKLNNHHRHQQTMRKNAGSSLKDYKVLCRQKTATANELFNSDTLLLNVHDAIKILGTLLKDNVSAVPQSSLVSLGMLLIKPNEYETPYVNELRDE